MQFKHFIHVVHMRGEATVLSFMVARAFNTQAHVVFDNEATRNWYGMRRINDQTLAGYHYANQDGTVVLELR